MLTIKFPVHKHVIDVNQLLGSIQQIIDDLFSRFALPDWPRVQNDWYGISN